MKDTQEEYSMGQVSVRMPDQLIAELEERVVNSRYKNKSELIRDLVRRYIDGLLVPISVPDRRR